MKIRKWLGYFSRGEWGLFLASVGVTLLAFFLFDGRGYLALTASLIGATSLIFNAKGNPFGQVLMILFSLLYSIISYGAHYYGEMLTYLGMTAPMALFALIAWLRHPYKGNLSEVRVAKIGGWEMLFWLLLSILVSIPFYFILEFFGTANLLPSTLSVTTSFLAVALTARRSSFYALAYAANDIVLLVLWILQAAADRSAVSVIVCFAVFLVNDLYGFLNWRRMERRQNA